MGTDADAALAERLLVRDEAALRSVIDLYGPVVFGMARNKAIDLVRREESLRRTKDSLLAEAEQASEQRSEHERIEEGQEVAAALRGLTPVQREAIVLAYYGGRTYREVAEELQIPEGTAKTRLRDGLIKLKQLLSEGSG